MSLSCYMTIANGYNFQNKGPLTPKQASDSQSIWASAWLGKTSLFSQKILCASVILRGLPGVDTGPLEKERDS